MKHETEEDLFGRALSEFHAGNPSQYHFDLFVDGEEDEQMPLSIFFREEKELNPIEALALDKCKGKILDVGAGAGTISKILLERGHDVTAIEISPKACEVIREFGVKTYCENIYNLNEKFDTILLLMNGLGMAGKLAMTENLLIHLKSLLLPGGQIIGDSSDIMHLYQIDDQLIELPMDKDYYGEVQFQMQYNQKMSPVFDWVYIDYETLSDTAQSAGLTSELLYTAKNHQYLVNLSPTV